jgi:hypothetical protein
MPENPYSAAATRWTLIVLGLLGSILSGMWVVSVLIRGSTDGCFSRVCVQDRTWTAAHDPTQFWFYVLFWLVVAILMGRTAWKAWRDG